MATNYFSIYQEKTLRLCRTIVIKSQTTAEAINTDLSERGYSVDLDDQASWKYFLNLSGTYHQTDEVMTIRSLDTLETIVFTKENLSIHKTTRKEYTLESEYFLELVRRYPEQRALIMGIINPVNLDTAINSDDHTILSWDSTLLEAQETNVIPELQEWVNGFAFRYFVDAYNITDDLYCASFLGCMFLQMPAKIMAIRLANCHTEYVHSYHIWWYLSGHSKLDDFRNYLTYDQSIWLYRNIRYLEMNVGKKEVFDLLIENILTPIRARVYSYRLEHNSSDLSDSSPYPIPQLTKEGVNVFLPTELSYTIDEMLGKENTLATLNPELRQSWGDAFLEKAKNLPSGSYPTKIIEVEMTDETGAIPYNREDISLNHWFYLATENKYNGYITFSNPFTRDRIRVNAYTAMIAFVYCWAKSRGTELYEMPYIHCWRIINENLDYTNQVRDYLHPAYIEDDVIQDLISDLPTIRTITNVEDFIATVDQIYTVVLRHRNIVGAEEHYKRHGELRKLMTWMYPEYKKDLNNLDVHAFLREAELPLTDLTQSEAEAVATEIFTAATGFDPSSNQSLYNMQEAMIRLMQRLCGYDLQWIQTTNMASNRKVDWATVRGGDMDSRYQSRVYFQPGIDRVQAKSISRSSIPVSANLTLLDAVKNTRTIHRTSCPMQVHALGVNKLEATVKVRIPDIRVVKTEEYKDVFDN